MSLLDSDDDGERDRYQREIAEEDVGSDDGRSAGGGASCAVDYFCEDRDTLDLVFDLIGNEMAEGRGAKVTGKNIFKIDRGRYSAADFAKEMAAGLQKSLEFRIETTVLPVLHLVQLHCGEAAPANLTHGENPKKLARLVANVLHFQLHEKVQRTANNGRNKLAMCDASDTSLSRADWARSFMHVYGGVDKKGVIVAPDDPRRGQKLGDASGGSEYASKIIALRACICWDGTRNQDGTRISRQGKNMVR
jgi:hypothetical protein